VRKFAAKFFEIVNIARERRRPPFVRASRIAASFTSCSSPTQLSQYESKPPIRTLRTPLASKNGVSHNSKKRSHKRFYLQILTNPICEEKLTMKLDLAAVLVALVVSNAAAADVCVRENADQCGFLMKMMTESFR
jgi:hypothetical protein